MPVTGYKRWKLSRVQAWPSWHGPRGGSGCIGTVRVVGAMEDETRRDEEAQRSATRGGARQPRADRAAQRAAGRAPGGPGAVRVPARCSVLGRFDRLDASDRRVYFAAVLATVASTICLMAPTAHHRLRFRSGIKEQLLRVGNVFAIVGLVLLAFAMAAVTYVITDEIYPGSLPRIVTSVLVATFVVVWFVLPMFFRRERTPEPRAERLGRHLNLGPILGPPSVECPAAVHPTICVGPEQVSQSLDQGRRQPLASQRVVVARADEKPGVGTPSEAPVATARRRASARPQRLDERRREQQRRQAGIRVVPVADAIRKRARMMQPPRQIVAIAPRSMPHPYSSLPAAIWSNPCA